MAIPFYLLVAWLRPSFEWIAVVYTLEQLAGALAGTALPVFLMRRCKRAFSASHYAFFSAITALTATVAGGLHHYLLAHGVYGDELALRIEQGVEMGRPSLLHLSARSAGGKPVIRVGGRVIESARGELV